MEMHSPQTNVVVSPERERALAELADSQTRSSQELLDDMIDQYLAYKRYYRAEVEAGIADAEAGRFATDEEVAAAFCGW